MQAHREEDPAIAVIAWGSLIWNPADLELASRWHKDGPVLPIEFARMSKNGAASLVVTPTRGTPGPDLLGAQHRVGTWCGAHKSPGARTHARSPQHRRRDVDGGDRRMEKPRRRWRPGSHRGWLRSGWMPPFGLASARRGWKTFPRHNDPHGTVNCHQTRTRRSRCTCGERLRRSTLL